MSLEVNNLSGINAPIGSYLCNSIQKDGGFCSDTYDVIRGKILYMNDSITLSGTESWCYCSERKAFYFHCKNKVINQNRNTPIDRMICNRFVWREDNKTLGMGDFSGGPGDLVYFHDDSFNGCVDSFTRWLKEESAQGHPVQLVFSLEKPFICSVDFSSHARYYGFENTYVEYDFMGQKERIILG